MLPVPRLLRLLAVLLFLLLLWAVFQLGGLRTHFTLQALHDGFETHWASGLLLFSALFALGNLIQIPGWIFLAAAVLALGRLWGGVVTYAGAVVTCISTYWIIRALGGDVLREVGGRWGRQLIARLDAHPVQSVLLLRLLMQTAPVLNYVLALSGLRFRPYLVGTLLGLPLPIALYCVFFDSVAHWLHWT